MHKYSTRKYLLNFLLDHQMTYKEYLESDHWKDIKKRFYASKLHRWKCCICGERVGLNIHHKTYKRIGREKLSDLILLCKICHEKVHKAEKSSNLNLASIHKKLKKENKFVLSLIEK